MPYIVDGYNLYHAICKLSEDLSRITPRTLCCFVAQDMSILKNDATIVFDGNPWPRQNVEEVEPVGYVKLLFSGPDSDADSEIEHLIQKSSAPRRLTVISSDRRLYRAARKRRARWQKSTDYLFEMFDRASRPPRLPPEPPEKRKGVPEGELDHWLDLFGIDNDEQDDGLGRTRM